MSYNKNCLFISIIGIFTKISLFLNVNILNNKKIVLGLIFSILGFIYIILITGINNLGATPDSTSYIQVSRNIFNGNGLEFYKSNVKHLQWPPLFPIVIFFYSKIFTVDSIIASKFLSASLFFSAVFTFNLIIIKFQANYFTIVVLNLLLLTSIAMSVFLFIWSEQLFILLLLLNLLFFLNWIDTNNILILLIVAFLSGLLILTRYAGLGISFGIIFYLVFKKEPLKNKLLYIIFYSMITFGTVCIWIIYLSFESINTLHKELIFHPVSMDHLRQLKSTLFYWVSPSFTIYGVIIFFLIFILFLFDLRKQKIKFQLKLLNEKSKFLFVVLIFYFVSILITISFFDFHVYLENRILAPAFPVLLILSVPAIEKIQYLKSKRYLYYLALSFVLFSYCYDFFLRSNHFYFEGEGYTNKLWFESETLKNLKKYNAGYIYTNSADVINLYYSNAKYVFNFPNIYILGRQKENIEFNNQIKTLKNIVDSTNSILVYFYNSKWRSYYPNEEFFKKEFVNFQLEEFNDGFILYNKNNTPVIK